MICHIGVIVYRHIIFMFRRIKSSEACILFVHFRSHCSGKNVILGHSVVKSRNFKGLFKLWSRKEAQRKSWKRKISSILEKWANKFRRKHLIWQSGKKQTNKKRDRETERLGRIKWLLRSTADAANQWDMSRYRDLRMAQVGPEKLPNCCKCLSYMGPQNEQKPWHLDLSLKRLRITCLYTIRFSVAHC